MSNQIFDTQKLLDLELLKEKGAITPEQYESQKKYLLELPARIQEQQEAMSKQSNSTTIVTGLFAAGIIGIIFLLLLNPQLLAGGFFGVIFLLFFFGVPILVIILICYFLKKLFS